MARCDFCGTLITKGTGKMFIKKDATVFNFCSSKCQKNQLKLKRKPRNVRWTMEAVKEKKTLAAARSADPSIAKKTVKKAVKKKPAKK